MARPELDERFPYGLDRPGEARLLAAVGMGAGLATLIAVALLGPGAVTLGLLVVLLVGSVGSGRRLRTSRTAKVAGADRLLDGLALRGDERALDLGCGTGLLCAGLAVRLPEGHVTGVDAWVPEQLQPTGRALAKETLRRAGVRGVVIRTAPLGELPLADGSVDLVVSRDALALCGGAAGRRRAVAEICRVLAPEGRVALLEPRVGRRLARALREVGMEQVRVSRPWWGLAPVHRLVSGRAPAPHGR